MTFNSIKYILLSVITYLLVEIKSENFKVDTETQKK